MHTTPKISPEDFKRFPTDGELFEFFVEALLREQSFLIDSRPARGPDGGRDLIAVQRFVDLLGTEHEERILVQCKHYAHGGRAVSSVGDFRAAMLRHNCPRYLLVTSSTVTEGLKALFEAHTDDARYPNERANYWTVSDLVRFTNDAPRLIEQYFPQSLLSRELLATGVPLDEAIETIADSVECGISIVDSDCNVAFVNKTQQSWFPKVEVGTRCYEAFNARAQDRHCPWCPTLRAAETRQISSHVTHSPVGPKQTLRFFQVTTIPLPKSPDKPFTVVESVTDISEQVIEQRFELQIAELNELGNILATLAKMIGHYFGAARTAWIAPNDRNDGLVTGEYVLDMDVLSDLASKPVYLKPLCAAIAQADAPSQTYTLKYARRLLYFPARHCPHTYRMLVARTVPC